MIQDVLTLISLITIFYLAKDMFFCKNMSINYPTLPLSRAGKRKTFNSKINCVFKRTERHVFIFMEALTATYLVYLPRTCIAHLLPLSLLFIYLLIYLISIVFFSVLLCALLCTKCKKAINN